MSTTVNPPSLKNCGADFVHISYWKCMQNNSRFSEKSKQPWNLRHFWIAVMGKANCQSVNFGHQHSWSVCNHVLQIDHHFILIDQFWWYLWNRIIAPSYSEKVLDLWHARVTTQRRVTTTKTPKNNYLGMEPCSFESLSNKRLFKDINYMDIPILLNVFTTPKINFFLFFIPWHLSFKFLYLLS